MQANSLSPVSFFRDRVNELFEWFSPDKYLNGDTFSSRLRSYQTTAFVVFFVCSFLNFLNFLHFSYIITSVSCFCLIIVRHFIERNALKTAYVFLLLCFNFSLVLLVYVEGLRSGTYLFFFPCIISFAFLTDFTNKRNLVFTFGICVGSFLFSILVAPEYSILQSMTARAYAVNFGINVFFSVTLIAWMSFSLARENHRKQSVLINKEVFLNTIFNSSLYAEVIVDMETGLISDHNTPAVPLFDVSEGQSLVGKAACSLFYELSQEGGDVIYAQMCDPVSNWEGELTCLRSDSSAFPGWIRISNFDYNGKAFKKITISDITERKRMLNELEQARDRAEESAAVKTQFLSNMSHELRTPLNGIIGATNLLLQEKYLPSQQEHLNVLKFSSEHMLSLINDVLDLSKLDAQKVKLERIPVDIPKFISSVAAPFGQQFRDKDLAFDVQVDDGVKQSLVTDPTRLNQVLANLLSNALKFTSNGGVTLAVRALAIKSDSHMLEFSVSDTGIGISEEKRKRIFDQFTQADEKTTRKYGGTGLGLTISQKLVDLLGGELKVESKYNKGSRFYFTLNLPVHVGKEKVYINEKTSATGDALKGLKVLIAEDNPINMMIAARFLGKWGVQFTKAKNGLEAVSLFMQQPFDLILMDLEMPEMDGYGALGEIRKINTDIPAIAFTAAVFENMREKLTASGFDDYIQKPFQPDDLYRRLARYSSRIFRRA